MIAWSAEANIVADSLKENMTYAFTNLKVNKRNELYSMASPGIQLVYTAKSSFQECENSFSKPAIPLVNIATFPPHQDKEVQTDVEIRSDGCSICGIRFDQQMMAFMHRGVHTVNNSLRCNVCGELCRDGGDFLTHITWGHIS